MKRVAILGGGPAGAFAAEQLASAGLGVVLIDEKLAWEKPCGGGLTYKAYSQYPFLIENATPKRMVTRKRAGRAQGRRGDAEAGRAAADLFALRPEPHAARAGRARRRADRKDARDWAWSGRARAGACRPQAGNVDADFCIVATGARNPLRDVGTQLTPPDTMSALGYYVPGDQERIDIQFLPDLEGYIWVFPRCGHLSVGICGKGEPAQFAAQAAGSATWRDAASPGRARRSTATCCRRSTPKSWKQNRVAGEAGWRWATPPAWWTRSPAKACTTRSARATWRRRALLADAAVRRRASRAIAALLRRDFAADLEFGSRLAKRVFLGRFLLRLGAAAHGGIHAPQSRALPA